VSSQAVIGLKYPLTPTGNLGYGEKAAQAAYLAVSAQVDSQFSTTIADTFEAYKAYLLADKALSVAREGLKLAEEQLKNARLKYEEGISPRFEVIQGEVALSQAKEDVVKATNNLRLAKSSLLLTIGINLSEFAPDDSFAIKYEKDMDAFVNWIVSEVMEKVNADELYERYVEKTPDFRSLKSSLISIEYRIKGRKRAPFLSLFASYMRQSGSSFMKKGTWQYGVEGVWNLFDSGKTESLRRSLMEQKAKLEIELERYRQAFRLSIEDSISQLESAILGWQTAKNTLAQAEEALRMTRIGYEEGVITHADLLSSRTAYLSAKLREFSGRLEVVAAYYSLLKTLGITDISAYLPSHRDASFLLASGEMKRDEDET